MSENFGSLVSRVLDPTDIAYQLVVWSSGKPPTAAELNFIGQLNNEERQKSIRALMPSGFLGNPSKASLDFYFHRSFSNQFYMGRQLESESAVETAHDPDTKYIQWVNVNGWIIPITGTKVDGTTLVNDDYRNRIELPFAPTSEYEVNFVFLEVWKALIATNPSTTNKPTATTIYKYGNVEYGGTNVTDDLKDTNIGSETSRRVQLQYRIRVVPHADFITYPQGFEDTGHVYARAGLTNAEAASLATSVDTSFVSMAQNGDPGLWRAGDGDPTNGLGTVDGYVYAIPICGVPRRNRGGWSITTTNGGLSRKAVPTGYVEGEPSGCALSEEELDAAPASDRPDGLYADLITEDDVVDLRHHVAPGSHKYQELLQENLRRLWSNKLATTPKLFTAGGSQFGKKLLYTDEINGTGTDNSATITIGEPDGVRRIFSDVPVYQGRNFEVVSVGSKDTTSPSYASNPDKWMPGDIIKIAHPSSLRDASYPSQFITDDTRLTYGEGERPVIMDAVTSATSTTLVSTGAFTNWYNTGTSQLKGFACKIMAGTGVGQIRTVNTIDSANQITLFSAWTTTPDTTSFFVIVPMIVEYTASADDTELTLTISSINGDTSSSSSSIESAGITGDMWVEYTMHYPAGQGLSLRPDEVHRINYTNPISTVLLPPTTTSGVNELTRHYLQRSPDFANPASTDFFGDPIVTADAYVDVGSKTVVIQPWQRVSVAATPRRLPAIQPDNSYFGLFSTQLAIAVPQALLPALGYNAIPVLEAAEGVFASGLNVWLVSEADSAQEVCINVLGRSDFEDDSYQGDAVFARKNSLSYEQTGSGATDKYGCRINPDVGGIEFPQYIGISRIIGIFQSSDFDTNGLAGTNLLKVTDSNVDLEPNIWVGRTTGHADVTFTVLPAAIENYSASTEYVIVANVFGFREGFIHENTYVACHEQHTDETETVTLHVVVPQALPSSAILQVTYSRTPYQGSVYSRMEPFAASTPEPFNNRGLVSPDDLTELDTALTTSPDQGNTFHFEVLAVQDFVTTLGTARFSGIRNGRFYGKQGMAAKLPAGVPKHEELPLSDVQPDYAGLVSRLPLGARYRDADFAGEDIVAGSDTGAYVEFGGGLKPHRHIYGYDVAMNPLAPGQVITLTEGNVSTYSDTSMYRTTRGGSGYLQLERSVGGPLSSGGRDCAVGYRALYGVALLVRNFKEQAPANVDAAYNEDTNPLVLKDNGGELQMIILTSVTEPLLGNGGVYSRQTLDLVTSPNGLGEGYVAVDRYRIEGRPLEHQPLQILFEEETTISGSYATRVRAPSIKSVYPSEATAGDAVVVRGRGLAAVASSGNGKGAEIYARNVDSISNSDLVDLSGYITDTSDAYTIFQVPAASVLPFGDYDILVRAGDGQQAVYANCLSIQAASSAVQTVHSVENFASYSTGPLPVGTSGIGVNSSGLFRITDLSSALGYKSGLFKGTKQSTTETLSIDVTTAARVGTDVCALKLAFRLNEALPTGNVLTTKWQCVNSGTYYDLMGLSLTSSSSFFTFTVYGGINGGVDLTVVSTAEIDQEWHELEFVVDEDATSWSLLLDGVEVDSGTASGTIFSGKYEPRRYTISNSVTSGTTKVSTLVGKLVTQNYATSDLTE